MMLNRVLCRRLIGVHRSRYQHYLGVKACDISTLESVNNDEQSRNLQWKMKLFHGKRPGSEALLNVCKSFQLDVIELLDKIWEKPEIANFNVAVVSKNIEQLFELGFDAEGISRIITEYPYLMNYEANQIINTFEVWRSCSLHEGFLRELFIQDPWLFSVCDLQAKQRLTRIHYLMEHKINRITSILLLNPSLLTHNWDSVEANFEYVMKTMRILEKEISRSTALIVPMTHLKLRHHFLEKCGVYVRPNLKDNIGFIPHKNPTLSDIVDTSDHVFAVHVAKVSLDEYEVYKKLYSNQDDAEEGFRKKELRYNLLDA